MTSHKWKRFAVPHQGLSGLPGYFVHGAAKALQDSNQGKVDSSKFGQDTRAKYIIVLFHLLTRSPF